MGFQKRIIKGLIWSAVEKAGNEGLNLIVFLLLARLLEPEDFGLVAMANVLLSLVSSFQNLGMEQALIQQKNIKPEHFDTAFWTNIILSMILCMGIGLLSGAVASFYNTPELQNIIICLSITLPLSALSSVQLALLKKKLAFKGIAYRALIGASAGGTAGIGAAIFGLGVWSLVIQSMVASLVQVIVLWRVTGWRPEFRFSCPCLSELFEFGRSDPNYS